MAAFPYCSLYWRHTVRTLVLLASDNPICWCKCMMSFILFSLKYSTTELPSMFKHPTTTPLTYWCLIRLCSARICGFDFVNSSVLCSSMCWPSANNMSSTRSTPARSAVCVKTVYARVSMCPLVHLSFVVQPRLPHALVPLRTCVSAAFIILLFWALYQHGVYWIWQNNSDMVVGHYHTLLNWNGSICKQLA